MDLLNSIIGTLFVAICITPIIIINIKNKKKEKKALQSLINMAEKQNCNIHQYEHCNHLLIGIDNIKKVVFLYTKKNEIETNQFINLNDYIDCKIHQKDRLIEHNNHIIIENLYLTFIPKLKNNNEVKLEFYNSENTMQLNGELQFIQKWLTIIKKEM